jgi:hypothetical protein
MLAVLALELAGVARMTRWSMEEDAEVGRTPQQHPAQCLRLNHFAHRAHDCFVFLFRTGFRSQKRGAGSGFGSFPAR